MVPRLIRTRGLIAALMALTTLSAGEAFGWGRSYYPRYQAPGYTYYYQSPTYYYPAPAPAGVQIRVFSQMVENIDYRPHKVSSQPMLPDVVPFLGFVDIQIDFRPKYNPPFHNP